MRRRRAAVALIAVVLLTASCTPPNLPAPLTPDSSAGDPGPAPQDDQTLVIGVDGAITGFNPYVAAQYSLAGQSVAKLVLPSVFPPGAISPESSSTALVDKVEVTALSPFTVTYTLNKNAAWTDGTPIAAEDFTYLWQQMISQPGLVDSGGYQLISDIESADAGKTVIVEFAAAYSDWRSLFSPLLPARTLKDLPGGFSGALLDGIPVSGSSYKLKSFDPINGEILLARNDKYWGPEPGPVEVLIRIGPAGELTEAIDRGDVDAVYLQPDSTTLAQLRNQNPTAGLLNVPLPVTDQIDFALDGPLTANLAVRRGLALSLDLDELGTAWSDERPGSFDRVNSMLALPAARTSASVSPLTGKAENAFAEAGFSRTGVYYTRDDQVLRVVAGYPVDDPRTTAAAAELQAQLGRAGILVDLVGLSTPEMISPGTAVVKPDLILRSTPRGPSNSAVAVAAFNCRPPAADALDTALCPMSPDRLTPSVDPQMLALLGDGEHMGPELAALDALLWGRLYSLPVAEPQAVFVFGDTIPSQPVGADSSRLLWGGPLVDLPTWNLPG